jgi:hypothetical protein
MSAPGFIEINAAMYDQEGNTRSRVDIASYRGTLWDEHLQQYDAALGAMPEGGRLALWNQAAAQNVSLVNASSPPMQGKSLPYSDASATEEEMNSLGSGSLLRRVELASGDVDATKSDDDPYGNPYKQTGPAADMLEPTCRVSAEGYTYEVIELHLSTDDGSADGDCLSINGPAVSMDLT